MSTQQKTDSEMVLAQVGQLSAEKKKDALMRMIGLLRKQGPSAELEALRRERWAVPLSIFSQDKLSCLEAMVKYLKENKAIKFSAIAAALNRDNRTIWTTYATANRKMPEPLRAEGREMQASLIADRTLSVLEHVVSYAKALGMKNHEVALLLHLDDRTIWSAYNKAKQKRERNNTIKRGEHDQ